MNQFGDRELNEILDPMVPMNNETFNVIPAYEPSARALPGYSGGIDWRTWGGVQRVKNQNGCGSCYVFAAVS